MRHACERHGKAGQYRSERTQGGVERERRVTAWRAFRLINNGDRNSRKEAESRHYKKTNKSSTPPPPHVASVIRLYTSLSNATLYVVCTVLMLYPSVLDLTVALRDCVFLFSSSNKLVEGARLKAAEKDKTRLSTLNMQIASFNLFKFFFFFQTIIVLHLSLNFWRLHFGIVSYEHPYTLTKHQIGIPL